MEDFKTCLGNMDVARIKTFRLFNFGEPLFHPNLPELIRQLNCFPWKVGKIEISTNAQCHNFEILTEVFKTGLLDLLVVSCDGDGTPEEYERLRPPAKWDKLVEFLEVAKEMRDKYSSRIHLITRSICKSPEGKKRWNEILVPRGWTPQFRDWLNLPSTVRKTDITEKSGNRGICPYLGVQNYCYVDFDGTVVPCCAHPRAFILGNLKTQKFSEILYGVQRRKLVQMLANGRNELPICSECEL
jgi:radical SAM protein with 4Fe4S-binding SPASM domain